jgi:hypothetical protein
VTWSAGSLPGPPSMGADGSDAEQVTLPANPDPGGSVLVVDATGNAGTHNITVTASVPVIGGTIATNNASVLYVFDAARGKWVGR